MVTRAQLRIAGLYPKTGHPLQARPDEWYDVQKQIREENQDRNYARLREQSTVQAARRSAAGDFANEYEQARKMKLLDLDYHRQLNADEAMHRQNQTVLEQDFQLGLDELEYNERAKRDAALAQYTQERDERLQRLQVEQANNIADHTAEIQRIQDEKAQELEIEKEKRELENAERLRKIERGEEVEAWSDEMLFNQAEQAQIDIRDQKRYLPKEQKDALAKLDAKLNGLPGDPEVSAEERPFVRADILRAKARIYANAPVVPIEEQEQSNEEKFMSSTHKLGEGLFFDLEERKLIDFRDEGNEVDASGRRQKEVEYEDKRKAEAYKELASLRKEEREYSLKLKAMTQYDAKSGNDVPLYSDEEVDAKVRKEFSEQRAALGVELEDPNAMQPVVPAWDQAPITGGNLAGAAGVPQVVAPMSPQAPSAAVATPSSSPSDSLLRADANGNEPGSPDYDPFDVPAASEAEAVDGPKLFKNPESNSWQDLYNKRANAELNLQQTIAFFESERGQQAPADMRDKAIKEAERWAKAAANQEEGQRDEVWAEIWLDWAEENLTEKQLKNSPEYLQVQKIVNGK